MLSCKNWVDTLPRGGMYWKIHPLRQFAHRGPRDWPRAEGCKLPRGRIFQFIPTRGHLFVFQSGSVLEITPQIAG